MPYTDKEARNAYAREWYRRNAEAHKARVYPNRLELREWFKELKSTLSCIKCGESHPACLDFHHRDPGSKDIAVYKANRQRWSRERVLREIAKCDVLCANCHRKVHASEEAAQPDPG